MVGRANAEIIWERVTRVIKTPDEIHTSILMILLMIVIEILSRSPTSSLILPLVLVALGLRVEKRTLGTREIRAFDVG